MTFAPPQTSPAIILANGEGGVGMPAALAALAGGRSVLDAVEAGIRAVELDPGVRSVGVGGAPNLLGEMELDASIIDGSTLQAGAVAALQGFLHPISVARQVMERLPHVLLAGDGAARFAAEIGAERGETLSSASQADYQGWLAGQLSPEEEAAWPDGPLSALAWRSASTLARSAQPPMAGGTTIFLVRDAQGRMAGGVSTSGWAHKYPGRVGDSPIIGAGLYVDERYGACACTHTGEMTMRAGTARAVVAYLKRGASVQDACHEAAADLRSLRGGYLGPVIIHALDSAGQPYVLGLDATAAHFWWWAQGMASAEQRVADHDASSKAW